MKDNNWNRNFDWERFSSREVHKGLKDSNDEFIPFARLPSHVQISGIIKENKDAAIFLLLQIKLRIQTNFISITDKTTEKSLVYLKGTVAKVFKILL